MLQDRRMQNIKAAQQLVVYQETQEHVGHAE